MVQIKTVHRNLQQKGSSALTVFQSIVSDRQHCKKNHQLVPTVNAIYSADMDISSTITETVTTNII